MRTDGQGKQIARRINLLLGEHGIPVGAKVESGPDILAGDILVGCYWSPADECFHAWIPRIAEQVGEKLKEVFTRGGFGDVLDGPCPGNEKFIQIDAYPL